MNDVRLYDLEERVRGLEKMVTLTHEVINSQVKLIWWLIALVIASYLFSILTWVVHR